MPNAAELLMEEHRAIRRLLTDAEERFLYPVVADSIPDCRELVGRAPAEHQQLRDAVSELERAEDPAEFAPLAAAVRAVFEPHVRVEEAEILPRCQDEFGEARMLELGRELDAFRDAH
jgi:hemerythrin-like domain-containing protein